MVTTPQNNGDDRLRARLALTGEKEITDWKEKQAYLEKRKQEAAKAMASDAQKKKSEEEERARLHKLESQKKLAALEEARRAEEELRKKDISYQQKEKDLAQEKIRQEKIRQILESQRQIEGIKKSPQSNLSSVHTLTDDLSEAIKRKGLTAANLALANNRDLKEEEKTVSWRKTLILSLSLLLILGGATVIIWSSWQKREESKAETKLTHDSIIFADKHLAVELKGKNPSEVRQEISLLSQQTGYGLDREEVSDIYFVYETSKTTEQGLVIEKKIANPTIFAEDLDLTITDDFLRFLDQNFMLGIYRGETSGPFYIFKTTNYKNTADALLHNENEIASQLLSPFITNGAYSQVRATPFQDKILKNRDLRLVASSDNQVLAVYAWLDKNTIIITTNELVLEKILNSFLTPKPVVK